MSIEIINPATGKKVREYQEDSPEIIEEKIKKTQEAYLKWRKTSFNKRADLMRKAGNIMRERKRGLAELMAEEMGKPITQGMGEAEKCAWVCDYYAEKHLADQFVETESTKSCVTFQPQGIVLAIMPWNFPFWQVFRFAAPTLMAGNAGLLKHSSNTMGCALEIEKVFKEAGFPDNLFTNLVISSKPVEKVIEHPDVVAVTLTGSTPVGRKVAEKAGSMLKKTVLELGGSDPYVVLEDADIEKTVNTCVTARLINSGQSCIAAKRFIVVESVYDKFIELYKRTMESFKMGDPLDESVQVGPQARSDLREELNEQVTMSIDMGAEILTGGCLPEGDGAFYPPTALTNVKKGMPAYDEEIFGPVASIIKVKDEEEAIRVANDTSFGLGAAVFTENLERGERIAREELQAGACFVNSNVKSDPRLPFGGVKDSGYGRELALFGIHEFVNIKTVVVD